MNWAVIVDSASDMACMKDAYNGEIGFETIALKLNVGEREFVDDAQLDVNEMLQCLAAYKGKSGSAAPSPGAYKEAFEKANNIVAITISGALSGSYASACAAKDMVLEEYPDKNIFVLDSLSTGGGMILLARKAFELIKTGASFEQVTAELTAYREKTHVFFILEAMDNLIKNGRVNKLEGGVAAILGIKVLGEGSEQGTLHLLKKVRGRMKVYDRMVEEMQEKGYCGGNVIIGHCNNEEKAVYVKNLLQAKYPDSSIEIMALRGLDSFYAENGGIIVGCEKEIAQ